MEEALLASAEEDQAVERWEQDMVGGPRRRGSPAAGEEEAVETGKEGMRVWREGGKWIWMDWVWVENEHGGVFKPGRVVEGQ